MKNWLRRSLFCSILLVVIPAGYAQEEGEDEYLGTITFIEQTFEDGKIARVHKDRRSLEIRGKNGKVREFSVPQSANITIRGKEARFSDLRRGDTLTLMFAPKEKDFVITRVRNPDAVKSIAERRADNNTAVSVNVLPKTAGLLPMMLLIAMGFFVAALAARYFRLGRR